MPTHIRHIAEVALRVNDLPKMRQFYTEVLGLPVHKEQHNAVFLTVGELASPLGTAGHPQLLALFERHNDPDVKRSTLDHLAFEVDPAGFAAELERFKQMDMVIRERVWPKSLLWRGRAFFFYDPEGNIIEFIAGDPE